MTRCESVRYFARGYNGVINPPVVVATIDSSKLAGSACFYGVQFDFVEKTALIEKYAINDSYDVEKITNQLIQTMLDTKVEDLPKKALVAIAVDPWVN